MQGSVPPYYGDRGHHYNGRGVTYDEKWRLEIGYRPNTAEAVHYGAIPVFPNLFDLLPKIAYRRWVVTLPQSRTNNIFNRNTHVFRLHSKCTPK